MPIGFSFLYKVGFAAIAIYVVRKLKAECFQTINGLDFRKGTAVIFMNLKRIGAKWASIMFVFFLATSCGGRFDTLKPVPLGPFLDKTGRLSEGYLLADVDGGSLAAVVVNFQGQNLKAESINMNFGRPFQGTMQDIVVRDIKPYKYHLFEVKNQAGAVLGYLLVREGRLVGQYLENDMLILRGQEPRLP